jgi:hypothetical protein
MYHTSTSSYVFSGFLFMCAGSAARFDQVQGPTSSS